jgi:hypothetical protein
MYMSLLAWSNARASSDEVCNRIHVRERVTDTCHWADPPQKRTVTRPPRLLKLLSLGHLSGQRVKLSL